MKESSKLINISLQKIGSVKSYKGTVTHSPLDQFYDEQFNMAEIVDSGIEFQLDSKKIYIHPADGVKMYRQMSRWIGSRTLTKDECSEITADIWNKVGPVFADFIPIGHLGLEEGFMIINEVLFKAMISSNRTLH